MAKLEWDLIGNRFYETGLDRGVLYVRDSSGTYPLGVPWNGLISVSENPSGADPNPQYADNVKYLNLVSREEFGATIEAFTYPNAFAECDGSKEVKTGVMFGQQPRKIFGLSYRTLIGNDSKGEDYGYKIHLIYGALATPSEKGYNTVNETPEAMTFSWEITTTPVDVEDFKPTAMLVIETTLTNGDQIAALEQALYGVDASAEPVVAEVIPHLPLPDEVIEIMAAEG